MCDINKLPENAREYFNSLPKNIQETIMQSGISITSKQDLESLYNHFTAKR